MIGLDLALEHEPSCATSGLQRTVIFWITELCKFQGWLESCLTVVLPVIARDAMKKKCLYVCSISILNMLFALILTQIVTAYCLKCYVKSCRHFSPSNLHTWFHKHACVLLLVKFLILSAGAILSDSKPLINPAVLGILLGYVFPNTSLELFQLSVE